MQRHTVLNRHSGNLRAASYVLLPTCPKLCTEDLLLCSRVWNEPQDLLICALLLE